MQHFKFVNWRIRFLMSRTGYKSFFMYLDRSSISLESKLSVTIILLTASLLMIFRLLKWSRITFNSWLKVIIIEFHDWQWHILVLLFQKIIFLFVLVWKVLFKMLHRTKWITSKNAILRLNKGFQVW